jgi:hypothetical protein
MLNNKPQGQQQRINVDINTLESITCPNCACIIFEAGLVTLKKLSAVQSPTGKEQLITLNLVKCSKCDSLFLVQNNALLPIQEKALPKSTKLTN